MWNFFPQLTSVLDDLVRGPEFTDEYQLQVIENFVVLLYSKTSSVKSVNEASRELFSKRNRIYLLLTQHQRTCQASGVSG